MNLTILMLTLSVLTTTGATTVSDSVNMLTAPDEAIRVVTENLNSIIIPRALKDPSYFEKRQVDIEESDYSLLRLGDPIAAYMIYPRDICNFADSVDSEIPAGGELVEYYFPVYRGGDFVFGVSAMLFDGKWRSSGFSYEPNIMFASWLSQVRTQYPPEQGYCVSILRGEWLNACFRLHLNGELIKIAAPVPAQMVGSQEVKAHIGPWISVDNAVNDLRARAQWYKKKWCNKSHSDG